MMQVSFWLELAASLMVPERSWHAKDINPFGGCQHLVNSSLIQQLPKGVLDMTIIK